MHHRKKIPHPGQPGQLSGPVVQVGHQQSKQAQPGTLVKALASFKDFKKSNKYHMSVDWTHQLAAITVLLEEVLHTVDDNSDNDSNPATKGDLKHVADSINTTIVNSSPNAHLLSPPLSYSEQQNHSHV